MRDLTRRRMLGLLAASAAAAPLSALGATLLPPQGMLRRNPTPTFNWGAAGQTLRRRYAKLGRHFAFEYYPGALHVVSSAACSAGCDDSRHKSHLS